MAEVTIRLPDVGEGIAEAELVEWNVRIGEVVREDQILAAVMTDKATVEIPSPVTGRVSWLGGEIGQQMAVGGPLVRIFVDETGIAGAADSGVADGGETNAANNPVPASPVEAATAGPPAETDRAGAPPPASAKKRLGSVSDPAHGEVPTASPAVRLRAANAGIKLAFVRGTGPGGRITHEDLDRYMAGDGDQAAPRREAAETVREVKVLGLRRKIAERMAEANRRIPHITIVEEIDVTALEDLRERLNQERREGRPKLTVLPFLMAAIARAVEEQPAINAHFDDEADVIREYSAVHIGIATQTKSGLMVPVVRHCERRTLWQLAEELGRVSGAARDGTATRDLLTGSTISISSLGSLGAIATTPIINRPEVAIVGVNRMEIRPKWDGANFIPRKMMNLSSSFDHRVIDGWDAAMFIKRLKSLVETPSLIFVER